MRRRQFLATGTVLIPVIFAGCVHPPVVLTMDNATADDIANKVSIMAEPNSEEYTVVRSARDNGSATRTGRDELFDRISTVRVDNTFYTVSETRIQPGETTVYQVLIDFQPDDTTPRIGEIEYTDLPEIDRQHLDPIVHNENSPDQNGSDVGVSYGPVDDIVDSSVFVPEPQYDIIILGDNRYRIAVKSQTASYDVYRYTVTEVAPDVKTFADQVRDRYQFTLSGLSDDEQTVVEKAIDSGYYEDDDAFRSILDQLHEHDGINREDFYGTWLIEYEDTDYLTYVEW